MVGEVWALWPALDALPPWVYLVRFTPGVGWLANPVHDDPTLAAGGDVRLSAGLVDPLFDVWCAADVPLSVPAAALWHRVAAVNAHQRARIEQAERSGVGDHGVALLSVLVDPLAQARAELFATWNPSARVPAAPAPTAPSSSAPGTPVQTETAEGQGEVETHSEVEARVLSSSAFASPAMEASSAQLAPSAPARRRTPPRAHLLGAAGRARRLVVPLAFAALGAGVMVVWPKRPPFESGSPLALGTAAAPGISDRHLTEKGVAEPAARLRIMRGGHLLPLGPFDQVRPGEEVVVQVRTSLRFTYVFERLPAGGYRRLIEEEHATEPQDRPDGPPGAGVAEGWFGLSRSVTLETHCRPEVLVVVFTPTALPEDAPSGALKLPAEVQSQGFHLDKRLDVTGCSL